MPGKVMLLLIDNYDSFTYNLVHYLGELGAETVVHRNDALSVQDAIALQPDAIVISPGPCDPDRAGITLPLVRAAAGRFPVLGVCLGHQAIAQAFGATIGRAGTVMHGKLSPIEHDGTGVFADLPSPSRPRATTRWSPCRETVPALVVNARTADGTIMGLRHREPADPRGAVPSREHRDRARPPLLRNFLELGAGGGRRDGRAAALPAADRQGRDRRAARPGRGRRGVRADDDRQRHPGAGRRPAHGDARARRNRRGDHRRGAQPARADGADRGAGGRDRHLRHRRRRRRTYNITAAAHRGRRRRRPGRQARQPQPVLAARARPRSWRSWASTSTPSSRWSSRRSAKRGSAS